MTIENLPSEPLKQWAVYGTFIAAFLSEFANVENFTSETLEKRTVYGTSEGKFLILYLTRGLRDIILPEKN